MVGGGIANVALAGRDGMLTQAAGACSRKTLGVELASSVDIMPHGRGGARTPDLSDRPQDRLQGRIIIAVHHAFVSRCEGPSMLRNCVATFKA